MKTIFKKYNLATSGKLLHVNLLAMLRAAGVDGATSTGALPAEVLNTLSVRMSSPNVSGAVKLKQNSSKDCFYVVDGNEMDIRLSKMQAGVHRVAICAEYGTHVFALLVVDLVVKSNIPYLLTGGVYTPLEREASKDENGYSAYVYRYGDVVVWLEGGLDYNQRVTAFVASGIEGSTLEDATEENDCLLVKDADVQVYDPSEEIDFAAVDTIAGGTEKEVSNNTLIKYILGIGQDGTPVKITPANLENDEWLHEHAWGVVIDPNSSATSVSVVGNQDAWETFRAKLGRYFVSKDGATAIKLDAADSTKTAEGNEYDATDGHVMVRIPQYWYEIISNSDGTVTMWMAEVDLGETSVGIPEQWVGAYLAYEEGGVLTSRAGVKPAASRNINTFWNQAHANGEAFGLADYNARRAMMMLFLCEYHSLNCQGTLGAGMNGNGNNWTAAESAPTGETASLGDACGNVEFTGEGTIAGANHVSLFGIEDPYGWYWEMVQGVYFGSSNNADQDGTEIFIYDGNRMPSNAELTTHPEGEYRQLTRLTTEGWIRKMQLGKYFDIFPSVNTGGSASTHWCDYSYANATGQLLVWGGNANAGSRCGFGFSNSTYGWSSANSIIGARLAAYSSPTIVVG